MSFVSDVIGDVVGSFADGLKDQFGAFGSLLTGGNPIQGAINGATGIVGATGGFSNFLSSSNGFSGGSFLGNGLSQGASGLTSAFGGSNFITGATNIASSIGGFGVDFASKAIGTAGNIAPNFSTAASTATNWTNSTIGTTLNAVNNAVKTASNVYKAVDAIKTLTSDKPVNTITTGAEPTMLINAPAAFTPSVGNATVSPVGANNDGGFTASATMPTASAVSTSSGNFLPLILIAGAAYMLMKGKGL